MCHGIRQLASGSQDISEPELGTAFDLDEPMLPGQGQRGLVAVPGTIQSALHVGRIAQGNEHAGLSGDVLAGLPDAEHLLKCALGLDRVALVEIQEGQVVPRHIHQPWGLGQVRVLDALGIQPSGRRRVAPVICDVAQVQQDVDPDEAVPGIGVQKGLLEDRLGLRKPPSSMRRTPIRFRVRACRSRSPLASARERAS